MEKWIDEAFARACEKMERGAKRASEQGIIPYMGQKDGYSPAPFDGNSWWTGGFWPGMMWQLYAATGKDVYKDEALRVENLLTAELRSFMLLNHDVGFMYLLSTGACAACGLLELANVVGGDEAEAYRAAAMKLLTALNTLCADWTDGNMGILQKCTASYHNDGAGRHVNILYGDYFFIEALCKLRGTDAKLWMA